MKTIERSGRIILLLYDHKVIHTMPSVSSSNDVSYDSLPPWSCGVCTFVNAKSISKCRVCEIGERPAKYGIALMRQQQQQSGASSTKSSVDKKAPEAEVTAPESGTSNRTVESQEVSSAVSVGASLEPEKPGNDPIEAKEGKKPTKETKKRKKTQKAKPASVVPKREKRPRRSAARKALNNLNAYMGVPSDRVSAPSTSHYVGYVEEGETVDMIMKKFQMMEEVQNMNAAASTNKEGDSSTDVNGDTNVSEAQLEEIFRRTSAFTVESATRANDADDMAFFSGVSQQNLGWENAAELLELHQEDEGQYFWSGDVDEDAFWDDMYHGKKRNKKRRKREKKIRNRRERREKRNRRRGVIGDARLPGELGRGYGTTNIAFVSDASGHFITALKRVRRRADPKAVVYNKIPFLKLADRKYPEDPGCPASWAKPIQPYIPRALRYARTEDGPKESYCYNVPNVAKFELENLKPLKDDPEFNYLGITMDPPWRYGPEPTDSTGAENPSDSNLVLPEDLKNLNLSRKVMPTGIVFIWVRKEYIGRVIKALEVHDLYYVENLSWVKQSTDNTFVHGESPYFSAVHETLLIFRRGHLSPSGKHYHDKLELRHQRTEDVVFDYVQDPHDPYVNDRLPTETKPETFLRKLVERMLPQARLDSEGNISDRWRLLELWANPHSLPNCWTTVVQK